MNFSNASEAHLALITIVLNADKMTSAPEQKYLFSRVSNHASFGDMDTAQIKVLMVKINEELFSTVDAHNKLMQPEGIAQFCDAVRAALPEKSIETAFQTACEIACTDGLLAVERSLLEGLGSGLGISTQRVRELLLNAEVSYS